MTMGQVWSKTGFDGTMAAFGGRGSILAVTSQTPNGSIPAPLNHQPVEVSIDFDPMIDCDPNDRVRGFISMHSAPGANFAFADGSVHFISEYIDGRLYRALSTINGGEPAFLDR